MRVGTPALHICAAPGVRLPKPEWVATRQFEDGPDVGAATAPACALNRTTIRTATRSLLATIVFALIAICQPTVASAAQPTCTSPGPGKPILVTPNCTDPKFNDPYIITDTTIPAGNATARSVPVPYTFIHGGFRGTDATFSLYYPPANMYHGRFFVMNVHQLRTTGDSATVPIPPPVIDAFDSNTSSNQNAGLAFLQENELGFAFDTGAYLLESSPNDEMALTARDALSGKYDPSVEYRVAAAAAKFSRVLANQIYHTSKRPYGYLSGGSGGSIITITAAENTIHIWDGFVPYVIGNRDAIPTNLASSTYGLRVLSERPGTLPCIAASFEAGGSGDPYTACHLNREEAQAFREMTLLGFPERGWFDWASVKANGGLLFLIADYVPLMDPTYVDDFWNKPGYLGHDDPFGDLKKARIQYNTTVVAASPAVPQPSSGEFPGDLTSGAAYNAYHGGQYIVGLPPRTFQLAGLPPGDLTGADVDITSGPGTGKSFHIMVVNRSTNTIAAGGDSDPHAFESLQPGDHVRIDNSLALALETYHRHQVPPASEHEYVWNQFVRNGKPIYPQRKVLVGPTAFHNAAGAYDYNGNIHGAKMIVVQTLLDSDAYPWPADWYRRFKIDPAGDSKNFRLWFYDNANHTSTSDAHRVSYVGELEQAFRDLAGWVEKHQLPPRSTTYNVANDQIMLPPTAADRGGIQPVVKMTANGGTVAHVAIGQPVTFKATITVPPGGNTGKVVEGEWDFEGTGNFQTGSCAQCNGTRQTATLTTTHTYSKAGTYYAGLRATSQRNGDTNTNLNQISSFAFINNLGQTKVVVH